MGKGNFAEVFSVGTVLVQLVGTNSAGESPLDYTEGGMGGFEVGFQFPTQREALDAKRKIRANYPQFTVNYFPYGGVGQDS